MRKSKFSEAQIAAMLKEAASGVAVTDVTRKHGVSAATFDVAPVLRRVRVGGWPLLSPVSDLVWRTDRGQIRVSRGVEGSDKRSSVNLGGLIRTSMRSLLSVNPLGCLFSLRLLASP